MTKTKSARLIISAFNFRATCGLRSIPKRCMHDLAFSSAACPTMPAIPADSICKCGYCFFKKYSAIGLRQILPIQTTKICLICIIAPSDPGYKVHWRMESPGSRHVASVPDLKHQHRQYHCYASETGWPGQNQ